MAVSDRISRLRKAMAAHNLDAYLIPSSDPHQSEYMAGYWKSREWFSGFTGSAGLLVVTAGHAGLWTDSRYYIQAEQELEGTGVVLHKQSSGGTPEYLLWLGQELHAGAVVGIDGSLFSVNQVRRMQRLFDEHDLHLDYEQDMVGQVWKERPERPRQPVFEHALSYAGLSRSAKLQQVRAEMAERQADYYLVSTLDDIAWVLNLRSDDVPYNPVFIAYLVIGKTSAFLFIDEEKVPDLIREKLQNDGVQLKPYDRIDTFLGNRKPTERILLDYQTIHMLHYRAIPEDQRLKGSNLIAPIKACKNEIEINHIREAMRKDGVALTRLYRWLERSLSNKTYPTEYDVSEKLAEFRSEQDGYQGESFGAIVGYKGNGAIVHYRPGKKTSSRIEPFGLLLIDSGGQYIDGTTDITRTIALSEPTEVQKRHYTYVLKGHIAVARQVFPAGTTGVQLDTLARQFLWSAGMDYGHGTGHGVGFFLNVHEGPQSLSNNSNSSRARTSFRPGMLTSNEPGYYKTDSYGIRIENLVLCRKSMESDQGAFYQFETMSLFPIDTSLIDPDLMTSPEKSWLNNYHRQVYEELAPLLNDEERSWLNEKCRLLE